MTIKPAIIIERALQSNNCPNLILYGDKRVGKNYELMKILNDIIPEKLNKIIKEKDITRITNLLYTIFDLNELSNKTSIDFFNIILELVQSKNYYYEKSYRIIIFKNFNCIKQSTQQKLRVIIEKYRSTTIFILITHKFGSIMNPIQSRCLCIRFPGLTHSKKRELIRYIVPDKSYQIRSSIYDKSYKTNNISDIEIYSKFYGINNFNTPYEIIIHQFELILNKNKLIKKDIIWMKDISYKIQKYNLYNFYTEFLILLLNNSRFTFQQKIKLIHLFSTSEHKFIQSYRSLIHIESLFFKIYQLLA